MEEKDNSVGKPEEEKSGQPKLRKISQVKLKKVLREHEKWIVSQGKEGTKANLLIANLQKASLRGADLQKANLQGASLWGANLQGASLWGANLEGADLRNANLQKADLRETNLQGTNLMRANLQEADLVESGLREAILQNADLTDVKGLQGGQLAGANVSGAKLPEDVAKFEDGLKVVEEASRNARKLFFALLSACAYALLTIATTTDVRLLTNSASSPLPIIRTEIPIVWFYIAGPLILLCLYFYFHLYMQRLWEGLAKLPAVFPDGRSLDEKAYPWLLIGLVRAHVFHLKRDRPPLSHLQEWISIALAWVFMPATLVCFWLRYLPRQDWYGTGLHILLLVVAVWAGILFYRLAVGTLRGDKNELSVWEQPLKEITTYKRGVVAIALGLLVLLLSLGTINGVPAEEDGKSKFVYDDVRTWMPYVFEYCGFSPSANFREKDVSTKPSNWSGKLEDIKGASLRGRNLRYAQAERAFLVNADLRGTNLQEADLWEANLQKADLWEANLQKADLRYANLQKADLRGANLEEADLRYANLQEAKLFKANLQGADLEGANLREAYLWIAKFQGADLREAELQKADLSYANLQKAFLWYANLQEAKLPGANLQEAKLFGVNLQGTDLTIAENLTIEQLAVVKTLYKAKLDPRLMKQIKTKYPHLLEEPKPKK